MRNASDLIDVALEFAAHAHRADTRKGTDIPYISHPAGVGVLLAQHGCSTEVVCAGILHDTIEDTPVTEQQLRNLFGERITTLVLGASEPDKTLSWRARKEHTHEYLKTAELDVCLVVCADKLHNLRSIRRDLDAHGEQIWGKFNRPRDDQRWYYDGILQSLEPQLRNHKMFQQLQSEISAVFFDDSLTR